MQTIFIVKFHFNQIAPKLDYSDKRRLMFVFTNRKPLENIRELFPFPLSCIQVRNYLETIIVNYLLFYSFVRQDVSQEGYKEKESLFDKRIYVTADNLVRVRVFI